MTDVLLVGGPADLNGDIVSVPDWPRASVTVTAADASTHFYRVDEADLVEPYAANWYIPNDQALDPDLDGNYVLLGERGERGIPGPDGPQGIPGTNGVGLTWGDWANVPGANPPAGGQQAKMRYIGNSAADPSIIEFRGEFTGAVAAFDVNVNGMVSTAFIMYAIRDGDNYVGSGLLKITSAGIASGLSVGAGQVGLLGGVALGLRV